MAKRTRRKSRQSKHYSPPKETVHVAVHFQLTLYHNPGAAQNLSAPIHSPYSQILQWHDRLGNGFGLRWNHFGASSFWWSATSSLL